MINWIKNNRSTLIRNSFLLPILLVVIMSISHVVSWYDLGNPISWAIYLSIAIEIFALASIAAAGIKASKAAIWMLFGIVTSIQIIGNIFYEFKDINPIGEGFKSWMELIQPLFEDWDIVDHRRFLAAIQGGTLPIMSLTALHFYIQFREREEDSTSNDKENYVEDYFRSRNEEIERRSKERSSDSAEELVDINVEDIPISKENSSTPLEKDTDIPLKEVRKDKGNNATIAQKNKDINPNTGKFDKNN